jgi:HAD superfamily hydrolase (TIGR01509 family)
MSERRIDERRMLILDFDGVLVDSEPVNFESWNLAFDEMLGIRLEDNHFALVGLGLEDIYRLWSRTRDGLELSLELKEQLLARKNEHYFTLGQDRLVPTPGSLELIQRAHADGWYVAIASRSRRKRLLKTLEVMRLPAIFDVVLGAEDVVDPATDHKVHARAPQMFGIDPANCVVVEDSGSGVRNACACGIGHVIGYTSSVSREKLLAAGAHSVVEHLDEVSLIDIREKWPQS